MSNVSLTVVPNTANTPSLAAETAVITVGPVATGAGSIGVWISGDLQITPGTGTTAMSIRCRRGAGTGGASVDGTTIVLPASAGVNNSFPFNFYDTSNVPEQAGGVQYTITAQATGGTANGTVNSGHVGVEV